MQMASKLYVGNLSFESSEDDIREVFAKHGTVESVAVIKDRETGRARGFGFVEMSTAAEAQAAIRALDGTSMDGRSISVNEARGKSDAGGGGGASRGGFRDSGGRGRF
jgi:RNA recognition motif-containing protein